MVASLAFDKTLSSSVGRTTRGFATRRVVGSAAPPESRQMAHNDNARDNDESRDYCPRGGRDAEAMP